MKVRSISWLLGFVFISVMVTGCRTQPAVADPVAPAVQALEVENPDAPAVDEELAEAGVVTFSLETQIKDGRMIYVGVGGEIDGLVNPDLVVKAGSTVQVILINGDGMPHDVYFEAFKAKTPLVSTIGKQVEVSFTIEAGQAGSFFYYCTQPGHRKAGQEGLLVVES